MAVWQCEFGCSEGGTGKATTGQRAKSRTAIVTFEWDVKMHEPGALNKIPYTLRSLLYDVLVSQLRLGINRMIEDMRSAAEARDGMNKDTEAGLDWPEATFGGSVRHPTRCLFVFSNLSSPSFICRTGGIKNITVCSISRLDKPFGCGTWPKHQPPYVQRSTDGDDPAPLLLSPS
jgi:hypothetical protein